MRYGPLVHLLEGFHAARVLVFGDVLLDRFVYGTVERISPEAPIPVVRVDRQADMPGGAANVARNIADLGAHAVLIGVVGEDAFAGDLRGQLAKTPTIQASLIADDSRPTTVKTRYVADGQQVMRADRESCVPVAASVAERLLQAYLAQVDGVDLVVISDYAKGVLSMDLTRRVIDAARARGKRIVVDPKSKDFSKYRGATMITPNRLELQRAVGEECLLHEEVVAAASVIMERDVCDFLVVTRGKDGMSVVGREGFSAHLPTTARQVFDVSGAGDTVVAALALGLVAGGDVIAAASLANVAAGIVVGKPGTATVSPGEIMATLSPSDGRTDPLKIFTLKSVLQLVRRWRAEGLKIAFTNGCFDLLHPGHISLLDQARRTADRLIVGVNSDLSISRLKGPNRPVQGEVARATVLAAVKSVDAVVIFAEDTPLQLIELLSPDVLVKGADYTLGTIVGADLVLERGGKVVLADLLSGHSTTETVNRAAQHAALG
jgi:D-beta-D-heptose 7-phosphate kinase / D-beta-D-heptose 1-phosphate adenosyltransferase